jgi:Na+:H+ antiporter
MMEILFGLLLLLLATRVMGEGAMRLSLPASVGEIGAGALLAVMIFLLGGDLPDVERLITSDELEFVAQAGIFFLVLQAGIDMKPRDIARQSRGSFFIALGGAVVPLIAGFLMGYAALPESDLKVAQCFFVGVALSITAIPATVKILEEQGLLGSRLGQTIVAAAIFDDVIGLFLLAVLTSLISDGEISGMTGALTLVGQIGLFFAVTIPLGAHVYPRVAARLKVLQLASAEFSTLMLVALAYGLFAEFLGLHWIMGAFMAGLFFEPERVGVRAYNEMRIVVVGIAGGFLGPIFFATIGLDIDFAALVAAPLLVGALIMIAFVGKLIGAGLPAVVLGFSRREALAIGTGMSARGAVELVVISIAVDAGLFAQGGQTFISALIITAVVTTMVVPLVLQWILSVKQDASD